jgi:enamine deaminase RidA (YjgF/YER057c/UK114 family)
VYWNLKSIATNNPVFLGDQADMNPTFGQVRRVVVVAGFLCAASIHGATPSDPEIQRLNPAELPKLDYLTHVVKVKNGTKFLHIAGQTAINTHLEIVGQTVDAQADTALKNLDFALQAGGAEKRDVVQLNVFFVDGDGAAGKTVTSKMKAYFQGMPLPAITYLGVPKLVGDGMLVEIEGVAVLRK